MTRYRLASSPMVFAPGLVAWAINGAHFEDDRPAMVRFISDGWGIPAPAAEALVTKSVGYEIHGEHVVFEA